MDWYGCSCFLINFKQISPATRMESKRLESPQTKWQWCVICCTISPPEVDSPVRASECTTLTPFWVWNAQTHSSFSACLRAFFFLKLSNIFCLTDFYRQTSHPLTYNWVLYTLFRIWKLFLQLKDNCNTESFFQKEASISTQPGISHASNHIGRAAHANLTQHSTK